MHHRYGKLGGCVYTWCMLWSFTLGVNPCTLALSRNLCNYKNLDNTLRKTRGNQSESSFPLGSLYGCTINVRWPLCTGAHIGSPSLWVVRLTSLVNFHDTGSLKTQMILLNRASLAAVNPPYSAMFQSSEAASPLPWRTLHQG